MNDVIFKTLKEKDFIIKNYLIKVVTELKLDINDFLLLVYFLNQDIPTLNLENITSTVYLDTNQIMTSLNKLTSLDLIELKVIKDENNRKIEVISMDNIIKFITSDITKKQNTINSEKLFELFETEFGRTISPMEYEIVNDWIKKGFSIELIELALKEAVYHGAKNFKYIYKILLNWQEKGYKSKSDVSTALKHDTEDNLLTDLFEYNWIDEE